MRIGHLPAALALLLPVAAVPAGGESPAPDRAPRVIATIPPSGERNVDPGTSVVEVRFDRPMSRSGWSWCGGGGDYPELTGRPRFADDVTARLPVKLQPEHTYRIRINCSSGQNFRSSEGVPAPSTPLRFTTGPGDKFIPAHPGNFAAWNELKELLRQRYSHFGRLGIDWEAQFDEAQEWILRAPTEHEWAGRIAFFLEQARDPHLYLLLADGTRFSTWTDANPPNVNPRAVRAMIPGIVQANPLVEWARSGDFGYIAVKSWDNSQGFMDAIDPVMERLADARIIIIDVRENGGGDETQAKRLAEWFVDGGKVYETHRFRDPESRDGWTSTSTRVVVGNPPPRRTNARVLLLQGPACLSSNESFIAMMRVSPNCTTIGGTTGGSSANPGRFPLPNGVTLVLPRWEARLPDGSPLEGVGIPPDVPVDGRFERRDPVLEEALRRATAGG